MGEVSRAQARVEHARVFETAAEAWRACQGGDSVYGVELAAQLEAGRRSG